jgi:hypothetical protein
MNSNNRRGQSGVDMVMTYGWIFVVGIGAVIIMSQMGTFTPVPVEKTKYGFSQLMPVDWGVYMDSNRIVSKIENWAGDKVQIIGMHVAIDDVSCDSSGIVTMSPGQSAIIIMTCSDSPSLADKFIKGSAYTAEVTISYVDVASGATYVSKGTVRGPVEEGSVTTTTSTPLSDLTILSIDAIAGGDIHYVISNPSEDLDAPEPSTSGISVQDKSNNIVDTKTDPVQVVIPKNGGTSEEATGLNTGACLTPGENYLVTVCADSGNVIPEQYEDNNCLSKSFYCPGPDQPPVVELISPRDCYDESNTICYHFDASCPC